MYISVHDTQPMTLNGLLILTVSFTVISQMDIQPIIETNFSKDNKCMFLIRKQMLIK